jgi:hypothetical protein
MWNQDIIDTLNEGFVHASNLSDALYKFGSMYPFAKDMVLQHEVMSSHDILKLKCQTMERFRNRNFSAYSKPLATERLTAICFPRSDLFRNHNKQLDMLSTTERIIIDDVPIKVRSRGQTTNRHRNDNISNDAFDNFGIEEGQNADLPFDDLRLDKEQMICYRKWGDEILIENGLNANAYPSCAPAKPQDMILHFQE